MKKRNVMQRPSRGVNLYRSPSAVGPMDYVVWQGPVCARSLERPEGSAACTSTCVPDCGGNLCNKL